MKFFSRKNNIIGAVMILIGLLAILNKYFEIKIDFSWSQIWPFLLIFWGLVVIMKK